MHLYQPVNIRPRPNPFVREYAAMMQVNFNTLMRTYEYLANKEIIYNKRGVGYFMASDCIDRINKMREETFYNTELRYFFDRLRKIGVSPERLSSLYSDYCKSTSK